MTATQATKQLLDMGCVFLSIVDIEGSTIIPKQQNKFTTPADIKKQADKINTYLKTAPNGTYVIEGRIGSTSKATQIVIDKGEPVPATAVLNSAPSRGISDHNSDSVLSYRAALDMQNQIATLTSENNRLRDLVEALEGDLADIEEAQPQQMAESPAMSAIGAVAPIIPAVIDQYFKAQNDRLEFEKMKFYEEMKAKQMQQQAQYQNNGHNDYGSL